MWIRVMFSASYTEGERDRGLTSLLTDKIGFKEIVEYRMTKFLNQET